MNILLISPEPPPYGGIANWTAMMKDYVKNTEDVIRTIDISPKKRATEGRTIFHRVFISGFDMFRKKHELKRKIKEERPDVIHMTTAGSLAMFRDILLLKTARKYKIPTVYHIRFGKTRQMAENNSHMWQRFSKAMKLAGVVAAIDKNTYDAINEYVPEAKTVLVPNPINMANLPEPAQKKKQVVFLGWVVAAKGVSELVKAWNVIGEEFPDYKLIIVGQAKQEYFEELRCAATVDNIVFTGEMKHNDAVQLLAESKVFILPSYTEGFPNSVLEAMALKNAVVATKVGAIPEMLADECGVLISPRSVDEIVCALKKVLGDEEKISEMASCAFAKVNREYSIEKVYEQYKKIWNGVRGDLNELV